MPVEAPPTQTEQPAPPPERWAVWQWAVVGVLAVAVVASATRLALRQTPGPAPAKNLPVGFLPLTPDQEIAAYQRQLGPEGKNPLVLDKLAAAYVRKARATSDPTWYLLAEQAARRALAAGGADPDAQLALTRVLLARHDFQGALAPLALAEKSLGAGPETGGLRFDIHMALGDLAGASKDLKGLGAYGVSLARHGLYLDATGEDDRAKQAMLASIDVLKGADLETVAWSHVNLANVLVRQGDHGGAAFHFKQALAALPSYVPALLGQAELARREQRWADVIPLLEPLTKTSSRADLLVRLAEAGRMGGRLDDAGRWYIAAGQALDADASAGGFWHRRDRVRWLLDRPQDAGVTEANTVATQELTLRHDLETVVLAGEAAVRKGDKATALKILNGAAATGVHDARVWYWLGQADAEPRRAAWLAKAKARDPLFDLAAIEAKAAERRAHP